MKKSVIAGFTQHITTISFQIGNCCLFSQNDRCTEIVFSRHQNTENQQNEPHEKNGEHTMLFNLE